MIKTFSQAMLASLLAIVVASSAHAQQPFDAIPPGNVENPQPPLQDDPTVVDPGQLPSRVPETDMDLPDQQSSVKEKFAGWQAAGPGDERLSQDLRANWVMADSNGKISGKVHLIGTASLEYFDVFLLNNGILVTSSSVDEAGNFAFTNVVQGAYSLVGVGDNGFFTFGFNAIDHSDTADASVPRTLNVTAFQNKSTINLDWIRYFAPSVKFRVFGRYPSDEGDEQPAQLYGYEEIGVNLPVAVPATSVLNHQVQRTADGKLKGRIHQFNSIHGRPVDIRETKVLLLQEDEVVGSTTTDNFGVFELENVASGEYAVVAAGVDGLGCIGVTVGNGNAATSSDVVDLTLASSETVGWLNDNAIQTAYRRALLRPKPAKTGDCLECGGMGCLDCCGNGYGMGNKPRRGFFQKVNRGVNKFFDKLFYPEEYGQGGYGQGGYGQGGYGGYGQGGYGGYGQGGYGGYGQGGYGGYGQGGYGYDGYGQGCYGGCEGINYGYPGAGY